MTELAGLLLRVHILVGFAALCVVVLRALFSRFWVIPARTLAVSGRALLIGSPILAVAIWPLPSGAVYQPPAQVWSGSSFSQPLGPVVAPPVLGPMVDLAVVNQFAVAVAGLLVVCALLGVAWWAAATAFHLTGIRQGTPVLHIGRVKVVECPDTLPFAFSTGFTRYIVVPAGLCSVERLMTVQHELQHHRHADGSVAHLLGFVRALCWPNPLVHLAIDTLADLDEIAVDCALIARNTDPHAYGRLLLSAATGRRPHALIAALAARPSRLKRRIEMILDPADTRVASRLAGVLTLAALTGLLGVAVASDGVVQDRRVTDSQFVAAVHQLDIESPLQVVDHALVRDKLDRYLGTPDGRRFVDEALNRYTAHGANIEAAARRHNVPKQVAAIAFVESGFENNDGWAYPSAMAEQNGWWRGAGMWMFIPRTAREFGMEVTPDTDERLDIPTQTEAAMVYLAAENAYFGDWLLAFASYNQGRTAVKAAIAEAGTDDPWTLIGNGHLNDYVPAVVAAALILDDPTLR